MPVKFNDAAEHAATLPNLNDRIAAIFSTFRTRLQAVDGRDKLDQLVKDFDEHHDLLVRTVAGDLSAATAANRGKLGPGETPYMPGDRPVSAVESERNSNPLSPIDSSGAKMHPADAIGAGSKAVNPEGGLGFGGNGVGTSADVLSQASRALTGGAAPTRSLQEQQLVDQTERQPGADAAPNANDKKMIPIIENEIVPGTEREEGGVRYVTKRRGDGTTYEALDTRPLNEPI